MRPETFDALTDVERDELRTIGGDWTDWAMKNIGANGDPWTGLQVKQESQSWLIYYMSRPTPFRTKSLNVGRALIEDAQMNLSKL